MSHEIEAKIRVNALEPIAAKLKQLNCDFRHSIRQTDIYYMDAAGQLRQNDSALRIRQEVIEGKCSALITFKGPRADGKFKNRTEYETGIADAEIGERIFESLGYQKRIVVEKKRMMWELDNCEVCLDELPELGFFVEVEGPDEATIAGVLEKLDLQNEPHIAESYASMISQKRKQE